MKFKHLEPGMVIYCCDDNDMDNLLKELERLDYKWYNSGANPTHVNIHPYQFNVLHLYDMDSDKNYKHITYSLVCKQPEGSLSYSDVVIEEPKLTAEEVLTIMNEICKEHSDSGEFCRAGCPFSHNEYCRNWMAEHTEETLKACLEWKQAQEDLKTIIEPPKLKSYWAVKCYEDATYESEFFKDENSAIDFATRKAQSKLYCGENKSFYVVKVYTYIDKADKTEVQ